MPLTKSHFLSAKNIHLSDSQEYLSKLFLFDDLIVLASEIKLQSLVVISVCHMGLQNSLRILKEMSLMIYKKKNRASAWKDQEKYLLIIVDLL